MKLAEALSLRADLQRRIAALRERLKKNARVQEGDTPAEDPMELLAELNADTDDLEGLMASINLTNCETFTVWEDSRLSLTELIAIIRESGQDPVTQLSGYLITEDPIYLPEGTEARAIARRVGRDKLLETLIDLYIRYCPATGTPSDS